jgi:hypothetical protein
MMFNFGLIEHEFVVFKDQRGSACCNDAG